MVLVLAETITSYYWPGNANLIANTSERRAPEQTVQLRRRLIGLPVRTWDYDEIVVIAVN